MSYTISPSNRTPLDRDDDEECDECGASDDDNYLDQQQQLQQDQQQQQQYQQQQQQQDDFNIIGVANSYLNSQTSSSAGILNNYSHIMPYTTCPPQPLNFQYGLNERGGHHHHNLRDNNDEYDQHDRNSLDHSTEEVKENQDDENNNYIDATNYLDFGENIQEIMNADLQNNEGRQEDQEDDNASELSEVLDERQFIRVSTAPARPLTDIEEFKRSYEFQLLEQAIVTSSKLVQKDYKKFDLDSQDGQKVLKKFLSIIERLIDTFECNTACRGYREHFSKAYRILYKEGELCYLNEILDSAQEGFPYLYVNGEKFTFTAEVLDQGAQLQSSFFKLQHVLRNAYTRTCSENLSIPSSEIKSEIIGVLEKFDAAWAKFEMLYVMELMGIEMEARRYVSAAIEIEKQLTSIEIREKIKGRYFVQSAEYVALRSKLCKHIAEINAVANVDGKGRDDLDFEILIQAEGILRRVSNEQSRAVRVLASSIQNTFATLRGLFHKYEQNIEMVDPQLKNNHDLVEALANYEAAWEKGKNYFLDFKKCTYLIHFSHVLETTANKYKSFAEQLECRDADIFLSIPCLLILKLLDNDDKNICAFFLPQMLVADEKNPKLYLIFVELRDDFAKYKALKSSGYKYYNTLERLLLNVDVITDEEAKEFITTSPPLTLGSIVHKIKQLAMEMQRNNPSEWNGFLDAAVCNPQ